MQTEGQENHSDPRTMTNPNPDYQLTAPYNKDAPEISARHLSPLRLLAIIIGGIFLAEVVAMLVVYVLSPLPYIQLTLIDAGIMTVLIFPLLYFLSFQPLLRYIQKSQHAEAALLRSMQLQERFFDSIDTLIAYMDRDFNFVRVNEAYARADGQRPEYFVGKNHFELYPHRENQAIFQRVVETGEAYSVNEKPFEYPEHPERGITYWNWSLMPVKGLNGDVGGVVLSLVDVTERVDAEKKNRQLSGIVEQTADTVVVTDCDGVIEYVNSAFERMTGYIKEEALGKTPSLLKSGIQGDLFYKGLWKTILKGEIFQSEIANRKKDGELFYEEKTIAPLRDERGDITHFVATGKDITERKQAEEELRRAYDELELRVQARTKELRVANSELEEEITERKRIETMLQQQAGELKMQAEELQAQRMKLVVANENLLIENNERKKAQIALEQSQKELSASEERARNLIQFAPAAIYEIDFFGNRFINVNDIACQWTGYTREELLSMNPLILTDEESKIRFLERIEKKLSGENVAESVEYKIFTKDGREIIVAANVRAMTYEDGRPKSALVVAHNITERKQAEEALRESEERYRHALDAAALGTWRHDPATGILFLDERARSHSGFEADTVTLAQVLARIHPDDVARVEREINIALDPANSTGYYVTEYRIIHPDGGIRWISVQANAYFEGQGITRHPVEIIGLSHEITKRKQAEEALRAANEELMRFNNAMVGRELRMIDLKKEVNELCRNVGQLPRYSVDFDKEAR